MGGICSPRENRADGLFVPHGEHCRYSGQVSKGNIPCAHFAEDTRRLDKGGFEELASAAGKSLKGLFGTGETATRGDGRTREDGQGRDPTLHAAKVQV